MIFNIYPALPSHRDRTFVFLTLTPPTEVRTSVLQVFLRGKNSTFFLSRVGISLYINPYFSHNEVLQNSGGSHFISKLREAAGTPHLLFPPITFLYFIGYGMSTEKKVHNVICRQIYILRVYLHNITGFYLLYIMFQFEITS